ncbi:MAG TPA: hypothetical protein VGI81_27430 [Tepidisphaeraceae bacterium]|jgi:hypothetical protein
MSFLGFTIPVGGAPEPVIGEWAQRIADAAAREAAVAAFEAMRRQHADWELRRATVLAVEPTRFLIAVFYHLPGVPTHPCPYRLTSVCRRSGRVAELFGREAVPYLLSK